MTDIVERAVDPATGIGNWIPQNVVEEADWIVHHLCLDDADNVKSIKSVLRVRLHARQEHAGAGKFKRGDRVQKTKGSSWHGRVVGFYSTELTPIGYVIESEREPGSCQLYPEVALELVPDDVASLRHECAGSGIHDHDGCTCTDEELRTRNADRLRHGLQNVADSLKTRPPELRGPFESSATKRGDEP